MKNLTCILFFLVVTVWTSAQQTNENIDRKNTIKVDLTSYWLYRNAVVFSYERVTKANQTFAVTAGYQQFPPVLGAISDNVNIQREANSTGLKFGGEYRFYLAKENKYGAPHGVYIGPYASYHNYSNDRFIEVNNNGTLENGEMNTDLGILNIGVQLGYQFVLNNRWTIDLVFVGPSVSNYRFKSSLDGNFSIEPYDITNEIIRALIDKYPAFEELIDEGKTTSNGKINTWGYGYRYQLQIGYHFGRKKK